MYVMKKEMDTITKSQVRLLEPKIEIKNALDLIYQTLPKKRIKRIRELEEGTMETIKTEVQIGKEIKK